jgi:Domain of unknown function (DUF6259)
MRPLYPIFPASSTSRCPSVPAVPVERPHGSPYNARSIDRRLPGVVEGEPVMESALTLQNDHILVRLADDQSGGLTALEHVPTGQNFAFPGTRPLYRLTLSRAGADPIEITSQDAGRLGVQRLKEEHAETLVLKYACHRRLPLDVECRVRLESGSPLTRWRISVSNKTEYGVRTIAYPVTITPPMLGESDEDDYYVSGVGFGLMANRPGMILDKQEPSEPQTRSLGEPLKTAFCEGHYPGPVTVQMQAYYDQTAGLYMATYDSEGHVKHFGYEAAEGERALDLSIRHYYDERPGLDFELPYDIVLGVFQGDWYAAADMYKEWAHQQHWCSRKLVERDDIPSWFTEPRPHLLIVSRGGIDRAQGTLPCPPSEFPLEKFWPAGKLVPLVEQYAAAFDSPAVVWLEGWEKIGSPGGPVDIFPPYEGEESFTRAIQDFSRNGHVTSLYLAGLHWCYRRASTGYYGEERFEREGRPLAALNEHSDVDRFVFASAQKHFVNLCVGCDDVGSLYRDNFLKLMDLGATWIQLDQQVGLYSPVCYSEEHGHPPGYGHWMYDRMLEFVRQVRGDARKRNPDAAFTCENACEIWIQEMDGFMTRPYLSGDVLHALPIFEYVYHEYTISYGGDMAMWLMHPDASCIKHALCCVYGLQNLISIGEPDYDLAVEEVDHPVLPLLASTIAAQRTYARDYLVFGRMLKPTQLDVETVPIELWWPPTASEISMIFKDIPAVVHGAWLAQDGKIGHVLVNWTCDPKEIRLELTGTPRTASAVMPDGRRTLPREDSSRGRVTVTVPARAAMLVEQE